MLARRHGQRQLSGEPVRASPPHLPGSLRGHAIRHGVDVSRALVEPDHAGHVLLLPMLHNLGSFGKSQTVCQVVNKVPKKLKGHQGCDQKTSDSQATESETAFETEVVEAPVDGVDSVRLALTTSCASASGRLCGSCTVAKSGKSWKRLPKHFSLLVSTTRKYQGKREGTVYV